MKSRILSHENLEAILEDVLSFPCPPGYSIMADFWGRAEDYLMTAEFAHLGGLSIHQKPIKDYLTGKITTPRDLLEELLERECVTVILFPGPEEDHKAVLKPLRDQESIQRYEIDSWDRPTVKPGLPTPLYEPRLESNDIDPDEFL
jgi:hypothetical protein